MRGSGHATPTTQDLPFFHWQHDPGPSSCSPPLYLGTLATESIHFHLAQCLRDKDRVSFIPEAGATQSLMEETPQGNSVVGFLLIVPSLPREGVSGLHRAQHLSPSKPLPPPPPEKSTSRQNNVLKSDLLTTAPPNEEINSMFSAPNMLLSLILIILQSSDCAAILQAKKLRFREAETLAHVTQPSPSLDLQALV